MVYKEERIFRWVELARYAVGLAASMGDRMSRGKAAGVQRPTVFISITLTERGF